MQIWKDLRCILKHGRSFRRVRVRGGGDLVGRRKGDEEVNVEDKECG